MTREQAIEHAKKEADARGIEIVVLHDTNQENPEDCYSVATKGEAFAAISRGCFQIASFRPGARG